jgi:low affinity Fe/Cu permease
MTAWFERFAHGAAWAVGTSYAFGLTVVSTFVWLAVGPFFGWSERWMVLYTTVLSIYTQYNTHLIENKQNAESERGERYHRGLRIQLDHLILTQRHAHNEFMGAEVADEAWLDYLESENRRLRLRNNA